MGGRSNPYRLAEEEFRQLNDPRTVAKTLSGYRELLQNKRLVGEEKDINYWRKKGFTSLVYKVARVYTEKSKRQLRIDAKNNSIKLLDNELATFVIPTSAEASCYYGYNTKLCVATSTSHNIFNTKTIDNDGIIVYVLRKNTNEKYAILYRPRSPLLECFDALNNKIEYSHIHVVSGIEFKEVEKQIKHMMVRINKARLRNMFRILREENR